MPHFTINMCQGDLSALLLQVVPKAASERNPCLIERLPRGEHAMRFSLETARDARGGCGRIPVQFRHGRERGGGGRRTGRNYFTTETQRTRSLGFFKFRRGGCDSELV